MQDSILEMAVDELCNMNTNRNPNEEEVLDILAWIDSLPLSCPKKHIAREFSDGVAMAELIAMYFPARVNLMNYTRALSKRNKANNWNYLNDKVLSKLGFRIDKPTMNDLMDAKSGTVEKLLFQLRPVIARMNKTILNYRIGRQPEAVFPELRLPQVARARTLPHRKQRAIKKREISVSAPKQDQSSSSSSVFRLRPWNNSKKTTQINRNSATKPSMAPSVKVTNLNVKLQKKVSDDSKSLKPVAVDVEEQRRERASVQQNSFDLAGISMPLENQQRYSDTANNNGPQEDDLQTTVGIREEPQVPTDQKENARGNSWGSGLCFGFYGLV